MPRIARSRLTHLERRMNVDEPPVERLLFLLPDLWPDDDRRLFEASLDLGELGDLVARRTGVRPVFGANHVWAITVPASEDMLAMTEDEKESYLERHETRAHKPNRWRWQAIPADGREVCS